MEMTSCGDANVWIFNVGDLYFDLAGGLGVPESEWRPTYAAFFAHTVTVPVQCVLIQVADTYVLVDAASSNLPADSPFRIPGYVAPPSLEEQIAAAGIPPNQIEHVVITHAHFDHYNGTTTSNNGHRAATYPNAQYYLGREDWNVIEARGHVEEKGSEDYQTLGWLARNDQLVLTDGEVDLGAGLSLVPTPGETPGHLAVKVSSQGDALYCIGDIYHHVVEVEQPQWAVTWANHAAIGESRRWLVQQALDEDALLVASHIAGAGKLAPTSSGVKWVSVDTATAA